jgi:multicomponent Na+:H+ antiporter subunit E
MPRAAGLVATLTLFWLVLSGHYTLLLLSLGAGSVALVAWIAHRMAIVDHEQPLHMSIGLPGYALWLAGEIGKAALTVTRLVWTPRLALRPSVERVPADGMTPLAQVIYANSITLTPGTLSISVDDESILVHSLQPSGIAALHEGAMRARAHGLESR